MYLLDTNAWIEVLNRPQGRLGTRVIGHDPADILLCSIVLAELYVGAFKSNRRQQQLDSIRELLQQFSCVPFDEDAALHFGQLREHLERMGKPIGPYDTQIAALALSRDLVLVTHNVNEFNRVPNLLVEDWLVT